MYPPEITAVRIVQEAGWAPERVGAFWRREIPLTPAGIRTADRPVHSLDGTPTALSRLPDREL
jgi:hypothetical protein